MFYFKGEESESYYDFSDDTKTVMYDKNEDGVWVRSEVVYEETGMTREQMEASCELQASSIFTYLDMYEQFNGQKMKKSSVEIAGRTCDEFNVSIGILGYGMSYIFAVDPETGMCLKWQISASAGMEGSASASFTCNKFESPYTIKLPTNYINADEVENNGGEESGNNNGDNGNENNGGGSINNGGSQSNNSIGVQTVSTAYDINEKLGYITISFARPNGEKIEFVRNTDIPAEGSGFSTTSDIKLVKVNVMSSGAFALVSVYYEATQETYDDIEQITYTPTSDPIIKTTSGEIIEGFTWNND